MSNGIYSATIELQILNYVFQKNSLAILSSNGIDESYFTTYLPHFKFIMEYWTDYEQIPSKETFQAKFSDSWEWLIVSDSEEYLVKHLKESKLYRDVIVEYNKIAQLIKEEKTDEAISLMASISQKHILEKPSSCIDLVHDVSPRYDSYMERVNNPNTSFVSTGFAELDEVLGGWDLKNETALICARTGVGKSWLLTKCAAEAVKAGLRVGYYSGEMEADLVGYRFDTVLGNIANGSLTHGNASIKEQYENYISNLDKSVKGNLFCITPDDAMFNGSVTVSKLKTFIEKYDLQMLCIDQFSLLDDQKGAKTPREQAVNISKDLRKLQRMKKIPFLVAVQLNREDTTENGPSTRNISESDRIGQDATTIIFLETKDENMKLIVGKSRNARTGDKLSYIWNKNTGVIRFVPTEGDARGGKDVDLTLSEFDNDKSDNVF